MRTKIKEGEFKHGKEINEWKKNDLSSDNNSDRGTVFCFNTLPLIKGVIYSFTNFKGYGSFDWVGLRNYQIFLQTAESEVLTCLHLNLQL